MKKQLIYEISLNYHGLSIPCSFFRESIDLLSPDVPILKNKKNPSREDHLVSVIMPCFNAEKYLKEAIESILNQSHKELEFIIIDDGSSDRTSEIIMSFDDSRIVCITRNKNYGISNCLNLGIDRANGKYIARMDADDISVINRLEIQYKFMEQNLDYVMCGTQYLNMEKNVISNLLESHQILQLMLLRCNQIIHPSVFIRKSILLENGIRYNENMLYSQDYDLWTKLINFGKICNLSEPLIKYRIHNGQISRAKFSEQKKLDLVIRKDYLIQLNYPLDIDTKEFIDRFYGTQKNIVLEDIKYIKDIWLFVSKKYSNSINVRNRKYFRKILIKDFISNLFESGVKPSIASFIKISYNLYKSNFLMINKVTLKLFLNCFLHSRYNF